MELEKVIQTVVIIIIKFNVPLLKIAKVGKARHAIIIDIRTIGASCTL